MGPYPCNMCPHQRIVDTMLRDSYTARYAVRRTKRRYSSETKAELLAACGVPGASIAGVASAHGMNANVLHRWLRESSHSRQPAGSATCTTGAAVDIAQSDVASFIAVPLLSNPPVPVQREIKVEVRKADLVMTVTWPMSAASEFARWSSCVLK